MEDTEPLAGRRDAPRELALGGLHLAALWALGVAQPLFDLLGEHNAAFFAVRSSETVDIVMFGVALVTVPPAMLLAVEGLAWLVSARLRRTLPILFVALLLVHHRAADLGYC